MALLAICASCTTTASSSAVNGASSTRWLSCKMPRLVPSRPTSGAAR
ncbi:MAG: hypothetical protein AVDCRST_MAG16-3019 [uncultured Frankineae bacterium]|uniref:Uncharacterized protein n=1 Tax=uncultured Frankineae bacterium TaxID=437475 RepID=A0A6J4MLQ0_9ACTN|nr:MAG: hypothetical protein AVDCRST_MAG16-3019 [uncultured Frankineae bacterium]